MLGRSLSLALVASVAVQGCSTSRFVAETARAMQEQSAGTADPMRTGTGLPANEPQTDTAVSVVSVEVGEAAWYGSGAHGRTTASGEIFDRYGMTAAHKTLPMDTFVRVTNLSNGRQVVLRINDRGTWGEGRVIDVSERAAELLGFKRAGLAQVRVEQIEPRDFQAQSAPYAAPGDG